jgi:hypothetical protein
MYFYPMFTKEENQILKKYFKLSFILYSPLVIYCANSMIYLTRRRSEFVTIFDVFKRSNVYNIF